MAVIRNPTGKGLELAAPAIKPGQILNPLGINGKGRMRSLTDELRAVGNEKYQIRKTDGSIEYVTFNRYVASAIRRLVAELLEKAEAGQRVPKGLEWLHRKAFEMYVERAAPLNEAGEALDGQRTLTVILSRESPVEVIDVQAVEAKDNGDG